MKVLIVRLSSIGDIVLTTPLIRCLRKKFPSAQIDFVLKKKYAEVLSVNPYISNLIFYDGNLLKCAKQIIAEKYDIIIDVHRNFRSFLLTLFAWAKVLRYKSYALQKFLLVETGLNFYKAEVPVFKRYLKAVEVIDVHDDGEGLNFFIDENIKNKFGQTLKNKYVGICPVAIWETKRWQRENFVDVAKRIIAKYDYECLIFGGKNDFDYCDDIKKLIGPKSKNLCGSSLQETAVALEKCECLITGDTGLMHIAESLKVPTVAIFGPTVSEFGFYPQLATSKIISKKLLCKPCSTKGSKKCPVGNFNCIRDIST